MKLAAVTVLILTLPTSAHAQQLVPVVEIQPLPAACCAARCAVTTPAPVACPIPQPIQLPAVTLVDDPLLRVQRSASRRRTAGIVLISIGAAFGALTVLSALQANSANHTADDFWRSMAVLNGLVTAGTAIPGIALLVSASSKAEEARVLEQRRSMWSAPVASTTIGWGGKF
jgi:hypothetical protein